MTIPELIEKLEKATGPDRELDADIAITLKLIAEREWWSVNYLSGDMIPAYTASIDAAVQLCERVLPGWVIDFISQDFMSVPEGYRGIGWTVEIINQVRVQGQSSKPSIALCIAILRALQPKEGE